MFHPSYFLWLYMRRKLYQKTEFNDSRSVNKSIYLWYSEYNKNVQKLNFYTIMELCWLFLMSKRKQNSNQQHFFFLFPLPQIPPDLMLSFHWKSSFRNLRNTACLLILIPKIWSKCIDSQEEKLIYIRIKHKSPDIPNIFLSIICHCAIALVKPMKVELWNKIFLLPSSYIGSLSFSHLD